MKKSRSYGFVTNIVGIACSLALVSSRSDAQVIATSGFNDQRGVNGNPTLNSPFQIGVTVHNQGVGESGWDTPWLRLGGFDDRAPVTTEFVHEGDASVKLFDDPVFGTSLERAWFEIVPHVRIDMYAMVRPGGALKGHAVQTGSGGQIELRSAGSWHINSQGNIQVFDKRTNSFMATGFSTLPNQWNKYSMIVDVPDQSWKFLFNDQVFQSPYPLQFINPINYVDRVNLHAQSRINASAYVDLVQISQVPESVPGDVNDDGRVDRQDVVILTRNLGERSDFASIPGDLNMDHYVTIDDLSIVQTNFGAGVPPAMAVVPEPNTSGLILSVVTISIALVSRAGKRSKRVKPEASPCWSAS